ncbi:MAG: proline--tRNA ligase [Bacteroidales bacterium]|nr:proline--tRNA ligase [Bacteroidales bacterium]
MSEKITPRHENYSQWYQDVIDQAQLAENSPVHGCMVIKPYGFAIWEKMRDVLDKKFKETGHVNAYFPLFIPKSFFAKEAAHVEGFAKECAVVTHYRLKNSLDGKGIIVDEDAKLEEELIVRPTSETIIWDTYRKWIQSYRDLPLLINQWANVVRWEMRTRLFLRTTEFLWQEGHTAHASAEEAMEEARRMLEVYADFAENYMAMPVIKGYKSPNERFAGAVETFCIEALMQDGKALQAGTSHFLGQNFAKAFDVTFLTKENIREYVWATSWGVSTRLMGALIMTHGDDRGLVLPPALAPYQVVIVPILKSEQHKEVIFNYMRKIAEELRNAGISVLVDTDEIHTPGWKFAHYEAKGIPLRIAVGYRDVENQTVEIARRDELKKEVISNSQLGQRTLLLLDDIQRNLYQKALSFRNQNTWYVNTWKEFEEAIEKGGFVMAHWDGTVETEQMIKEKTKATIRVIPFDQPEEEGHCILTGKPSRKRVVFARAY